MSTCSFMEGGTSVAVHCEEGCCDNECCKDEVDFTALYIALAVIIAFLLLLVIIALIVYCCVRRKKRKKGEWRENLVGNRNDVVPLSVITANNHNNKNSSTHDRSSSISTSSCSAPSSGTLHTTHNEDRNKLVQTGNPNPEVKDKILGGRSIRWNTHNPYRKQVPPRSHLLKPSDRSSQTNFSTDHADPYRLDKYGQTPTPRPAHVQSDSRMSRDRHRDRVPSYGDNKNPTKKRMWLPAPTHNTLAPRIPSGPGPTPQPHQGHRH